MKKSLSLCLACLIVFIHGCKKEEPVDPHLLKGSWGIDLQLHRTHPYLDPDQFLPRLPKCDSLPIVHKNLAISVHPASEDESPLIQQCVAGLSLNNSDRFSLLAGTQLKIDVSFYRAIKHVLIQAGASDDNIIITAYGSNGRIIERQKGNDVFIFDNDLDDLKKITLVNQKNQLFPMRIILSDQLP